jgi:uncharacterized protein YndB with AHSA1/START domain
MSARTMETRAIVNEIEVEIDAPVETVWKALTEDLGEWWLDDFHVVGAGSTMTFDARAGGTLIEQMEEGGSLLWYTVQMCDPGKALHLVGHLAPDWGGPSTSMLRISLEEKAGRTLLCARDAIFGNVSEDSAASQGDGWRQLFGVGLKGHVEK